MAHLASVGCSIIFESPSGSQAPGVSQTVSRPSAAIRGSFAGGCMDTPIGRATVRRLLAAKSMRAFADGYVALLLPAYLLERGFTPLEVGVIATVTLAGSGLATLAIGNLAHRFAYRDLLLAACALMAATGVGFAFCVDF